jgi:hypothetical protein
VAACSKWYIWKTLPPAQADLSAKKKNHLHRFLSAPKSGGHTTLGNLEHQSRPLCRLFIEAALINDGGKKRTGIPPRRIQNDQIIVYKPTTQKGRSRPEVAQPRRD